MLFLCLVAIFGFNRLQILHSDAIAWLPQSIYSFYTGVRPYTFSCLLYFVHSWYYALHLTFSLFSQMTGKNCFKLSINQYQISWASDLKIVRWYNSCCTLCIQALQKCWIILRVKWYAQMSNLHLKKAAGKSESVSLIKLCNCSSISNLFFNWLRNLTSIIC